MKILIKTIASVLAAASILVGLYCPLGYVAAAEPGMEHYRTILPFVFIGTILVGFGSVAVLRKA
ncbi:MAG: hypothetical protein JNM43_04170 [Planctomycetaceae bacterium]|nr:hypothetical protein [Planctomycetaceae bacterium]